MNDIFLNVFLAEGIMWIAAEIYLVARPRLLVQTALSSSMLTLSAICLAYWDKI